MSEPEETKPDQFKSDDFKPDGFKPNMVQRIQNLILHPREEWAQIDAEPMTVNGLMTGWAVPLAAIGPAAGLIGGQLFGYGVLGLVRYRPSLTTSLVDAVISYGLALAAVFIFALILDGLSTSFGGTRSREQAMKVAVFSAIPGWLAGVFQLIPALAFLGILGLYGLYLLFVGAPMLMRVPQDRAIGYVVVAIIIGVILFMAAGFIASAITMSMVSTMPASSGMLRFG